MSERTPVLLESGKVFTWVSAIGISVCSLGGFAGDIITTPQGDGEYAPDKPASYDPRGDLEEADRNYNRIRVSLGESCFTLLNTYVDGPLSARQTEKDDAVLISAKPDESMVVNDALAYPQQPCGNNPTDVRIKYRRLIEADGIYTSAKGVDIAEALEEIKDYDEYDTARDKDNEFDGFPEGFKFGLKFGPMLGLLSGVTQALTLRNRKRRSTNG